MDPSIAGAPVISMDNPSLISWVAAEGDGNIAAAQPAGLQCPVEYNPPEAIAFKSPASGCLISVYSRDPVAPLLPTGPAIANPVPWVKEYGTSYSGMYYSFVTAVANQVQSVRDPVCAGRCPRLCGRFFAADKYAWPGSFSPPMSRVEVCLYGSPNLAMTAPANAGLKAALDGWHSACRHLATYDYTLLHTDFEQQDPRMPVALVAGLLARSQYLAKDGALDGGSQANLTSLPYNPWNFYAYPRTRWNTNQTAVQIEQEFFNGYFREAGAPMLAYYQAMENYQFSNNVNLHYLGYCYNITPGSFPIGILATMQTESAGRRATAIRIGGWRGGYG